MKDLAKKLRELDIGLTNVAILAIFNFLLILFLSVFVYLAGFLSGVFWLIGATIGNILFFLKVKKPFNPLTVRQIGGYSDKEFYKRVDEYMRTACSGYNPWPVTIFSYVIVVAMMALSPNYTLSEGVAAVAIIGLLYSLLVVGLHGFTQALKARDPCKISKFFRVHEKVWRVDLKPVPRPSSITGVALLFYGVGGLGLILSLALIVWGASGTVIIVLPTFTIGKVVLFGISATVPATLCLATGHYLRKMRFEGAVAAIILSSLPIILGIFVFVLPLIEGYQPLLQFYHAIWMLGIPMAVIYIIKKNWRKFKRPV